MSSRHKKNFAARLAALRVDEGGEDSGGDPRAKNQEDEVDGVNVQVDGERDGDDEEDQSEGEGEEDEMDRRKKEEGLRRLMAIRDLNESSSSSGSDTDDNSGSSSNGGGDGGGGGGGGGGEKAGEVESEAMKSNEGDIEDDEDMKSCEATPSGPDPLYRKLHQRNKRRQRRSLIAETKGIADEAALEVVKEEERKRQEELAYLDRIIRQTRAETEEGMSFECAERGVTAEKDIFFSIDPKSLDVDKVIRKRFGGEIASMFYQAIHQDNHNHRRAERAVGLHRVPQQRRQAITRKTIFGSVKADWPQRPPSFIAGGMRMSACDLPTQSVATCLSQEDMEEEVVEGRDCSRENGTRLRQENTEGEEVEGREECNRVNFSDGNCHYYYYERSRARCFRFEWSKEYREVQRKYEQLVHLGDGNMLVLFVSHHAYHLGGLLQLALIFAKMGHMVRYSLLSPISSFLSLPSVDTTYINTSLFFTSTVLFLFEDMTCQLLIIFNTFACGKRTAQQTLFVEAFMSSSVPQ